MFLLGSEHFDHSVTSRGFLDSALLRFKSEP